MLTLSLKVSDKDLKTINAAADRAGTSRSMFLRNAALAVASEALDPDAQPVADTVAMVPTHVSASSLPSAPPEKPHGHAMTCKCLTCRLSNGETNLPERRN